jgi:quercetin dioxygenase-like cupin family protein
LKKLIWVIPSVLFFLFAGCSAGLHSIETVQLAKTVRSWDGETLPQYLQGQPEVTILRIRIPAGSKLEMHHHPVINAGVLLKGELTVVADDNKTLHLRAGDSIVELVNKKHYGKNEGKEAAEIIVFYAGVENKPITVK